MFLHRNRMGANRHHVTVTIGIGHGYVRCLRGLLVGHRWFAGTISNGERLDRSDETVMLLILTVGFDR